MTQSEFQRQRVQSSPQRVTVRIPQIPVLFCIQFKICQVLCHRWKRKDTLGLDLVHTRVPYQFSSRQVLAWDNHTVTPVRSEQELLAQRVPLSLLYQIL